MFFGYVKGLGFVKFLSVDGGKTQQIFFTYDFDEASSEGTEQRLVSLLNGEISGEDLLILKIEVI